MASPQVENGYTKIANEILDALIAYRLPGEQMQVLLCIIRASYGWNDKEASITHQQISEQTGIKRQSVTRAVKALATKKLLNCNKKAAKLHKCLIFNKDYDLWVPQTKRINCNKKAAKSSNKNAAIQPALPIIEKKEKKPPNPQRGDCVYSDDFLEFWKHYPKKVGKGGAYKSWSKIKSPKKTLAKILIALVWQKKTDGWSKDNGQFIPNPQTYLNQRRWEDEQTEGGSFGW